MHPNKLLKKLKGLFIKPKRDWSKSDREVLDVFNQLRIRNEESLKITPLNQSSYNDRRFLNETNPDFVGPGGMGGYGTKDRMPGSTPSLKIKPFHRPKKLMGGKNSKSSHLI